ncbi:MAG: uroporphyrinogen decarboxylase family protein [Bacillota bacterium]
MLGSLTLPVDRPDPDFDEFQQVLLGKKEARKVHLVELGIDPEIVSAILTEFLGEERLASPSEEPEAHWRQRVRFWHEMGYDYIRVAGGIVFPRVKEKIADDTAASSRGKRSWIDEHSGVISSWADFDKYPWPEPDAFDFSSYEFVSKSLPQGMKMMVCPSSGVFEVTSEYLLGFEGMSYLLYEDPELVGAVFNKVGELIYDFYRNIVSLDNVGGFFQGDDLGFKTSTFLSPKHLQRFVLPWHRRYAELAHAHGQMYWLHACGNLKNVMEFLIEDVKIDALHSFQDEIMPVTEFKARYGHRVAALGGVDVDKLCRMGEEELREYVRGILDQCMPGRYALGSGNSVANYVPVKNYLIMLDEGVRWGRENVA